MHTNSDVTPSFGLEDQAGAETMTMTAVVTTGTGGYEKLVMREVPVPAVG